MLRTLQSMVNDSCPNFTKVYLTEHLTERYFESTSPTVADVHEHVAHVLQVVRDLQSLQRSGPFSANSKMLTITIERLFLTFASRNLLTTDFFVEHSGLIDALELKNLLLVVPNELIVDRIVISMQHRNQGWINYISRLGGVPGAVTHFRQQQDAMLRASDTLAAYMPVYQLIITDLDELTWQNAVEQFLWPVIPAY